MYTMKTRPPAACPVFASDLQARLLGALFDEPERWRSSTELREDLDVSPATLHDELTRLVAAGILERDAGTRPYRFRPDLSSPFADPLKGLTERSVGVPRRLRRVLAEQPGITAAGIFGSWARGDADAYSDIDVLVVGEIDFTSLVRAIRPLEREIQREINVVAYDHNELARRRDETFIRRVVREPIQDLVGDLHSQLAAH